MKIEKKEPDFEPIILAIESQMELDVISELVALARGTPCVPENVDEFVSELSDELGRMGADPRYRYFCGLESALRAK